MTKVAQFSFQTTDDFCRPLKAGNGIIGWRSSMCNATKTKLLRILFLCPEMIVFMQADSTQNAPRWPAKSTSATNFLAREGEREGWRKREEMEKTEKRGKDKKKEEMRGRGGEQGYREGVKEKGRGGPLWEMPIHHQTDSVASTRRGKLNVRDSWVAYSCLRYRQWRTVSRRNCDESRCISCMSDEGATAAHLRMMQRKKTIT